MGLSAPFGQEFWFSNNRVTGNLYDFLNVLKHLPQEHFEQHVNDEKHDFANWMECSLKEHKLARKVRGMSKKSQIVRQVHSFLYM
jgi:hypothetical protein